MPTIQILVRVIQTFATEVPGPIAPGKRFVFGDDLVLERTTTARQEAASRKTRTSDSQARNRES
jgi:hypothetical protein